MTDAEPTVLAVEDLHKNFAGTEVLNGIDLTVTRGERIAILGASGSGKSTFLRCLNVLEKPSRGRLVVDGTPVGRLMPNGETRYRQDELNRLRTRIGMVFQQFHLFPHMTVIGNVMEGPLTVLRKSRAEARAIAERHLARVGLAGKAQAYPSRLSGGQRQRVAIARALAMDPEVLLFDEPTSSLDPELVGEVLNVIRDLSVEGRTMLLVTHELGFAYHFATRVLFLHNGRILEDGPPDEVLKHPIHPPTRQFLERFSEFRF